jgi:hypothetical protein
VVNGKVLKEEILWQADDDDKMDQTWLTIGKSVSSLLKNFPFSPHTHTFVPLAHSGGEWKKRGNSVKIHVGLGVYKPKFVA